MRVLSQLQQEALIYDVEDTGGVQCPCLANNNKTEFVC